jgi:hypothetical protein
MMEELKAARQRAKLKITVFEAAKEKKHLS